MSTPRGPSTTPTHADRRPRLLLVGVLLGGLLLTACAGQAAQAGPADDDRDTELSIVATMSIVGDLAEQVGGERVEVEVIVPVGADPHTFEPTPSDAAVLEGADLIVANGAGLEEAWLLDMVAGHDAPVALLSDGRHDLDVGLLELDGDPDPHLWNDPLVVHGYLAELTDALVAADPDGEQHYRDGAAAYAEELDRLDAWIEAAVATIPEQQRVLVTTHDAFSYFGERYDLTIPGTLYGVSTEDEPSAAQVAALTEAIRAAGVPTVFVESLVDPRLMERIAGDSGARVGPQLLGDSVGGPDSGAETYLTMMRHNVTAIVDGLGGEVPA